MTQMEMHHIGLALNGILERITMDFAVMQKGEPMRPIDADALKDRLQALSYDDWNQGVSTMWANAYAECADMVEDMPTIEPERKKGKWIEKDVACIDDELDDRNVIDEWQSAKCSVCGKWHTTPYLYSFKKYAYCPNCGADMRGEQP